MDVAKQHAEVHTCKHISLHINFVNSVIIIFCGFIHNTPIATCMRVQIGSQKDKLESEPLYETENAILVAIATQDTTRWSSAVVVVCHP